MHNVLSHDSEQSIASNNAGIWASLSAFYLSGKAWNKSVQHRCWSTKATEGSAHAWRHGTWTGCECNLVMLLNRYDFSSAMFNLLMVCRLNTKPSPKKSWYKLVWGRQHQPCNNLTEPKYTTSVNIFIKFCTCFVLVQLIKYVLLVWYVSKSKLYIYIMYMHVNKRVELTQRRTALLKIYVVLLFIFKARCKNLVTHWESHGTRAQWDCSTAENSTI